VQFSSHPDSGKQHGMTTVCKFAKLRVSNFFATRYQARKSNHPGEGCLRFSGDFASFRGIPGKANGTVESKG